MGKFTKYLCRKPALVLAALLLLLPLGTKAAPSLHFKGDYFLLSDDLSYIYGGGKITLKTPKWKITGDALYLDAKQLTGVIYGAVKMEPVKPAPGATETKTYDALFFKGMSPKWQWLAAIYGDKMTLAGDMSLKSAFLNFAKNTPGELKKASLFFEFREFSINKNGKVRARYVIPYMMGLPTVPLKRFTVRRGEWAERTMLAFNNLNYSAIDGLSASLFFRMRSKFVKGDYDIKLYERALFKLGDPKRGVLLSGQSRFLSKKKEFLGTNLLVNSGDGSFNLRLRHRKQYKFFRYALSQNLSGRRDQPVFSEFTSELTLLPVKVITPTFRFTHDFKNSYSYRVSTPLNLVKKLRLNIGWQRKIIRAAYQSDTTNLTTSMNFDAAIFTLSSNYNYSKNLLEATVRKNFSVNMRLKPLHLLMENVSLDVASFYMFSSLPSGDETVTRVSPGVNITLRSAGALLPLGFTLAPGFTFNHLWDNREENFTDFGYSLSLRKEIGNFSGSLDYTLASRYKAANFWIEGNNRQNLNLSFQFKDIKAYSFLLRFYWNTDLVMENISFTGQVKLPYDLRFSSFALYYNGDRKFRTLEIFIEKSFRKKIRIQGGYSLALKRFFIKFLTT